jgi:maltose alpha-D-glucosyltransferase/alpha-amylase
MIRSFSYAAHAALNSFVQNRPEHWEALSPWTLMWEKWASATFLKGYLDLTRGALFLPTDTAELETLLSAFLLDKALYELTYELNHRPDWVRIPLAGLESLIHSRALF